jgi:DNA invertase Pin-like site-specific DNA recombinase
MTILGYARVSTGGQDTAAQIEKLRKAGATQIFRETMSGARNDRPELKKALRSPQADDVLMVTAIDRLARNTPDLLNILEDIKKVGAKFKSLSDPWADTTSPTGELILTVLAGIATFERHLIRVRTSEGRARAVARGVKLGPKPKLSAAQIEHAKYLRLAGKSHNEIAAVLKVSNMTVRRAVSGKYRAIQRSGTPSSSRPVIP